jgi:uncharacterized membrane protein
MDGWMDGWMDVLLLLLLLLLLLWLCCGSLLSRPLARIAANAATMLTDGAIPRP